MSPEGSGSSNGSDPSLPPRFDDLDRIVDRAVRIVAHQDDDADSASTLTPRAADRVATIAPEQTTCSETLPPPSDAVGAGDAIGEIDLPVTPGDPIASDVAASDGSRRDAPEKQRVLVEIRCLGGFEVTSGDRKLSPTGDRGNSYKA